MFTDASAVRWLNVRRTSRCSNPSQQVASTRQHTPIAAEDVLSSGLGLVVDRVSASTPMSPCRHGHCPRDAVYIQRWHPSRPTIARLTQRHNDHLTRSDLAHSQLRRYAVFHCFVQLLGARVPFLYFSLDHPCAQRGNTCSVSVVNIYRLIRGGRGLPATKRKVVLLVLLVLALLAVLVVLLVVLVVLVLPVLLALLALL